MNHRLQTIRQFIPLKIIMEPNDHLAYEAMLDPNNTMNRISNSIYETIRYHIGSLRIKCRGRGVNLLRAIRLFCEFEGIEAELDFVISEIDGVSLGMESLRTYFNLQTFNASGIRIVDARNLDIRLRAVN